MSRWLGRRRVLVASCSAVAEDLDVCCYWRLGTGATRTRRRRGARLCVGVLLALVREVCQWSTGRASSQEVCSRPFKVCASAQDLIACITGCNTHSAGARRRHLELERVLRIPGRKVPSPAAAFPRRFADLRGCAMSAGIRHARGDPGSVSGIHTHIPATRCRADHAQTRSPSTVLHHVTARVAATVCGSATDHAERRRDSACARV